MSDIDSPVSGGLLNGLLPEADAHLLSRLRAADAGAGRDFVRDYYPAVYRYLLYLTGHRETAEDLTQETFLQAWRHLDQFQGRAPLRLWLHAIARREFLRARRRQRDAASLEDAAADREPQSALWTEDAELRVLLGVLPEEQREVMALHCLGGYSSSEIARIVQAPARTVRYRLALARSHLAQALGPGDLAYLNEPSPPRCASGRGCPWSRCTPWRCGWAVFDLRISQTRTPKPPRRNPWNDASSCAGRRWAPPG